MNFISLIAALALEYFRPLGNRVDPARIFARYADYLEHQFNGGQRQHGVVAWVLAVIPVTALAAGVYLLLYALSPVFGFLWNAVVLYAVMGYKYFSRNANQVARALQHHDVEQARDQLHRWVPVPQTRPDENEIARVAIEQTFLCAHRQLFGVIAWFLVLSPLGPAGAILYRLSGQLAHRWGSLTSAEADAFAEFARRAHDIIDWVPARLTAISFAIVGDFEDALYCWRTQAASWADRVQGIVLASGAGALGVKLGDTVGEPEVGAFRPELGTGEAADGDYAISAVGLVWRALVLWLVILLVVQLANWAG